MNTSDIENLEYVISEIEKAKEFWAKAEDCEIFKVGKHFSRRFMLLLLNTLKLGFAIKFFQIGNGSREYVLILKKEEIDIVSERVNEYLFNLQNDYYL